MNELPSLEPSDLECLDRLVAKGEMLMPPRFTCLEVLIKVGYAEVANNNWRNSGVALVMPTDKGREIVLWRKQRIINSVHKKV